EASVVLEHLLFFFSSRRRHTRFSRDWSSDVCSSDLKFLPSSFPYLLTNHLSHGHRALSLTSSDASSVATLTDGAYVLRESCPLRSEERRVGNECRSRWSPERPRAKRRTV